MSGETSRQIPPQNLKLFWEDSMRLRRNQLCPIHRSLACCGREPAHNERRTRQMGVRRIDDSQHPRGYREIRSNAEMRKLMDRKIAAKTACALSARDSSPTIATSFPITSIRVGWEEHGGTIIPTTSRRCIGAAISEKDRNGASAVLEWYPHIS